MVRLEPRRRLHLLVVDRDRVGGRVDHDVGARADRALVKHLVVLAVDDVDRSLAQGTVNESTTGRLGHTPRVRRHSVAGRYGAALAVVPRRPAAARTSSEAQAGGQEDNGGDSL